jgi:hypothetical protein
MSKERPKKVVICSDEAKARRHPFSFAAGKGHHC